MSLNALKNHLLSGFCPKVVKVPLQAHITDKRVVLCNTTLVYISWIVALVCYVFVFKGWSKKTRVQISYNMWIDPSTEIVQQPANVPYCDNPACEKRESQSLLVSKRNMLNPLTLFFFFFFFLLSFLYVIVSFFYFFSRPVQTTTYTPQHGRTKTLPAVPTMSTKFLSKQLRKERTGSTQCLRKNLLASRVMDLQKS